MEELSNKSDLPDFILKSTLGVSLISIFLITPFCINNFIQGRFLLGTLSLIIVLLFLVDAFFCFRGKYHQSLNLFALAPILIISISFVVNEIGMIGSYWAYLGVLSFYFMLPKNLAALTNVVFLSIIYPVAWSVMELPLVIRFGAVLAGVSIYAYISMTEISKQHILLKEKSVKDTLTGLYNRSLLQSSLEHAINQNTRANIPMSILMLDLDNFKTINDDLGHGIGDFVLKSLGEFLIKRFRAGDMVFRIGGEEFLILLHNTNENTALDIANSLRNEIEKMSLIPDRKITISIGVSNVNPSTNWEDWMKVCDEKLYKAKVSGRNLAIA